jgi:hypothetical protein
VPSLDLFVSAPKLLGPLSGGNLDLNPAVPGLSRVLLRRLLCALRAPPVPGAYAAVLDTGSPLALFPHDFWHNRFGWRAGRDFDELSVAGIGSTLQGQVLGHRFTCKLAQLRCPIELVGMNLAGDRLRLDSLVCQLADPGGPAFIILGLWGGAFTGRRLVVESQPNSDELQARLEY